jgi:hypothetical protein
VLWKRCRTWWVYGDDALGMDCIMVCALNKCKGLEVPTR